MPGSPADIQKLTGEIASCRPVIDIYPDLTVARCFGMSGTEKQELTDFETLSDIIRYYIYQVYGRQLYSEDCVACQVCYRRKVLRCYGGCIAFLKGGQHEDMYRFWQLSSGWVSSPRPEEASALCELMNSEDAGRYHDGAALSREEADVLCSGSQPWFHIHAQDSKLIGVVALLRGNGVQAELCIHIKGSWRGRGIGVEAVKRMKSAACLGMHLKELYVRVLHTNDRACLFYKRCGFQPVPELPAQLRIPGEAPYQALRCVLSPKLVDVSVVIPMYNSGKWIRRCIASLRDASCEILLVDDAFTDDTTQIATELAAQDARIKLLRLTTHTMAGGARNAGLRAAVGEYVFFLDSDDAEANQEIFLRMVAHATISRADCVMTAQYEEESERGLRLVRRWGCYSGSVMPPQRPVLYSCQFPIWMAWYRRSFLLEHRLTFPENVSYEDNYFSFVLASEVESVCFVPGTLIRHRIHSCSLAHIPDLEIQTSFFKVTDLCLRYINENSLLERYPKEMTMWYVYAVFFTALHVWQTILPDEVWIIREAIRRVKERFPRLFTDHIDRAISPEDRRILKMAWENVEALLLVERKRP